MLPMERMREPGWKWAKGFFSVVQRDLALVRAKMTDDAAIGISFIKYSFHDASERPEDQ